MAMSGWQLLSVPFLIGLNAFFVAAEYALVAIRPAQVERLRAAGNRRTAAAVTTLKANPADAIGAIQVCITMTNLLIGWIGEPAMSALLLKVLGPLGRVMPASVFTVLSVGLSFVIVTLLTVVFSELLPKALTLRYAEPFATLTAVPVLGIRAAVKPLVWLMNAMANAVTRPLGLGAIDEAGEEQVTAEEVRLLASRAADQGTLTGRERSLILNSLALGRRTARQIMVPRIKVAYLDLRRTMDENRAVMNEYLYSRLPLCDGGMDHVIGVVPTKEFLSAYHAEGDSSVLQLIARPPTFVPDTIPLDRLLLVFDEKRSPFAILADEHGGVEGIVTLSDVVDELIGDPKAADESLIANGATTPPAGATAQGAFVVSGELPIHELAARLGRDRWGGADGVVTVGGLVAAELGRIPVRGDRVTIDGVRLRVVEADARTAKQVEVAVAPAA
jgi:putative hemolysin